MRRLLARGKFGSLLRLCALLLGAGFIVALVHDQWSELRRYPWSISGTWAALSFIPLGISWALEIALWRQCLRSLGGDLGLFRAGQIWFLSNFVRYIPGNVWQFIGMASLAAGEGIPAEATLTSIVVHQGLSATAVVSMGALYLTWAGHLPLTWTALILIGIALGLTIGLHPRRFEWAVNLVLRLLKRRQLRLQLSRRQLAAMIAGYWVAWLLAGLGFALVSRALTPLSGALFPHLIATFILAYFIGYISLITPSGLGVREGAMVWFLSQWLSAPLPTVISLVARLWLTLGEIIGASASLVLWHREGRRLLRPSQSTAVLEGTDG